MSNNESQMTQASNARLDKEGEKFEACQPGGSGAASDPNQIVTPTKASAQTPQHPKLSWVGLIAAVFVIGSIAHFAGCDETDTPTNVAARSLTKAEWRQKALPYYNPYGGGRKLTTVINFKSVMGEPSSTQTIEGHAYWYYDCSDGIIQVVLVDPAMSGGTLAIDSINDY